MRKFNYVTRAGIRGTIDKLEQQFGSGNILSIDGKPLTHSQTAADPHGWGSAFEAAAARVL